MQPWSVAHTGAGTVSLWRCVFSSDQILGTEVALALVALACAFAWPSAGALGLARALHWARDVFRGPSRLAWALAMASFCGSALLAVWVHWPEPSVHDEFSYLLAADTFASGRLTNPAPEVLAPFETFHVLIEPTYASKYPSGQGLILALGKLLAGEELVGVWLSGAALAAGLAWMLWAWLPSAWAVLGASLASFYLCTTSYWTQSYWGGAVAALGGTLVFGALPRLARGAGAANAAWLGLGLALWMISRPFEGMLVALPAMAWFAKVCWQRPLSLAVRRVILAALAPTAALAWILVLNHAVTGSIWSIPYFVYDSRYAVAPPFLWGQVSGEPVYLTTPVREYWTGFARREFERQTTLPGLLLGFSAKTRVFLRFFTSPVMAAASLFVWHARHTKGLGFALATCSWLWLSSLVWTYNLPHYSAPIAGLGVVLFFRAARAASRFRLRNRRVGAALVFWTLCALPVVAGLRVTQERSVEWPQWRARMQSDLEGQVQPCVVFVEYGPGHSVHDEWVYNGADLASTRVLWARDLGPESNALVMQHYPGRRAYHLRLDVNQAPVFRRL